MCDFEWFPDFKRTSSNPGSDYQLPENSILVFEQQDDTGNYFEVHFAEQIHPSLSDTDLDLIIDESLATTVEDDSILTINSGVYKVDRELGEYGGYKIRIIS